LSKKLIIAEKPSVANDIARALGGFTRHGDYYERDDYVLSSAIGHLLELVAPEKYEVKRGKWSFANLPVIPPQFDLRPIERSEDRLKVLQKLMKRKDVTAFVNACDAGREGELIFRYIVQHSKLNKPVERLWLQSMTQNAIRDGFASLRADKAMLPLADAAICRSESDWLIGINGTRAMTAFNSKEGGFYKTTVGRVQTPTLTILVEREERIRKFKARDYWEVHARFSVAAGEYTGRWFDESHGKLGKSDDEHARAERLWNEASATALQSRCVGKPGVVEEESKPTTQSSPQLYDLTTLQREANSRFGFSARNTLGLAQALYEKHKVLTYPRTDARCLPEDYLATVGETLEMLSDLNTYSGAYSSLAKAVIKNKWVKPNKRIFNNEKISDHFAIIPTLQAPKNLSEPEQKLYDLVVKRFLAVFYPPAEFLVTTRITRIDGEPFKSEGKVMKEPGWLSVYGREAGTEDGNILVAVTDGKAVTESIEVKAFQTRPPARFSEATLLSAMEGAGKLVDDEELREAMSEKGLGTPATRAAVIEGLLQEDYIHRNGRELQPTPKAFSLMFALRHFGITELASPELTGDWEYKLKQMEQGKLPRTEFMNHITELTQDMVSRIKTGEIPDTAFQTLSTPCPKCQGVVQENYRRFQCQACDFAVWKVMGSREYGHEEVEELIRNGVVGPLQGFRSRLGRPFAAMVRLSKEFKAEFDFGQGNDDENAEPVDFTGQEALGSCPKCQSAVYEHELSYTCEKAIGPGRSCDFRTGRIILQRQIERDQVKKLLETGKTDLLHRFISKKGRPFSAFLVRGADGKIGFEFAPRAEKGSKGKTSTETKETEIAGDNGLEAVSVSAPAAAKKAAKVTKTLKAIKPAGTLKTAKTASKKVPKKVASKRPAKKPT
jgi:DNA topoisomerase-3